MKNLLILLLLFPLLVKSQDTIKIPNPIAKQIVKELISCDSSKAVLELTKEQLILTEHQSIIKDSIIFDYVQSGLIYEQRLSNEQIKFKTQQIYTNKLAKSIKKYKAKLLFIKITSSLITGTLTYFYIIK
jgi:hypothetical protein